MDRSSLPLGPTLRLTALLLLLLPLASRSAADELPPLPELAVLRQLQLAAQNCGRENSAATCEPARSQADRLLDHPRLSAACKDALWEIREGAEPVASNTYARREALNQVAGRLLAVCRPATGRPAPAQPSAGGGPG